jgi:MinD-like ATPase involved in chromosome partitioning or flagellar assembly/ActR/RegA family two-component response regulator
MDAMTGKRILIVDSDVASRTFVARNLQGQNHEVLQSGSGKEGLIAAWRDRPDLIVADPNLPDIKGEEFAQKLRQDPRTAAVSLVALSSDPTVLRIRSCLDAGFNDYITKSGQALTTLNEVVDRMLGLSSAAAKEGGLLIVFLSAKGGTGTSSLCANFAQTIAHAHPEASVAVADMVLPIGSIAQIVGYEGQENIVTASDMKSQDTTGDYFKQHLTELADWKFHLLAGSPDPESSNHLKSERIWDIISALRSAYDFVLVDLGRSLSRISLPLIQNADAAVLIVSNDLSTVMLTKTLWDYLKGKGMSANFLYPILNRAVGLEGLTKPEAEKILGFEIRTAMPYLGSNFTLANNQRQPFSLKFPKDTAAIVFKENAQQLVELARRTRLG